MPSKMLPETPGASYSRRRARLRISLSAFAGSLSSHAWRSTLRTEACRGLAMRPVKLVKIGAKVVRHARYAVFQMAEVAVPKELFEKILRLIDGLRRRPAPA